MARARIEIAIARPLEAVFAVVMDAESTARWLPMPVDERRESPPRRAALSGRVQEVAWTAALDLVPAGSRTRVEVTLDFEAAGPRRFVMGPYLLRYRGQWARALVKLKRMMEAGEL